MFASLITVRRAEYNSAGTDIQDGGGGVWQTPATTKKQQAGNRIALKKKKIKAEYNSAGKDTVKRDNIPRKCQERKLAQGCARREQRTSAGDNLAGFCKSQKMEPKFAYTTKKLYLCSGKEKNGQAGVAEVKDSREMCL